ncbi:MAG: GntR family transcriptional regulator [Spirochaetae bacterium HGW-Spirochaetae-8]|jgi:K+/H+ antiporter YhaU regulatory subunit KhtT|nr:MAG: GntR family transcriptional regulator [Spirochaetae bacterium HGW-Spirochaetae-8]
MEMIENSNPEQQIPLKKTSATTPAYSRIALDIASRIARGELHENTKLYGRSIMSSEYGVSPETIRRSFSLLEEMQVVEIKHNSGVVILSRENSLKFIEKFSDQSSTRQLVHKLKRLVEKQVELNIEIQELARSILDATARYSNTTPFHNFECEIPAGSPVIDHSIGEMNFWQKTHATIIAIRRDNKIILSPGPHVELQESDILILVGTSETRESVLNLLQPM